MKLERHGLIYEVDLSDSCTDYVYYGRNKYSDAFFYLSKTRSKPYSDKEMDFIRDTIDTIQILGSKREKFHTESTDKDEIRKEIFQYCISLEHECHIGEFYDNRAKVVCTTDECISSEKDLYGVYLNECIRLLKEYGIMYDTDRKTYNNDRDETKALESYKEISLEEAKCISTAISYRYFKNHKWLHEFVKVYEDIIDRQRLDMVREVLSSEKHFYSERNVIAIAAYLVGKTVISIESYDILGDMDILEQLHHPSGYDKIADNTEIAIKSDFIGMDRIFSDSDYFIITVDMLTEKDLIDRMKLNQYIKQNGDFDFGSDHWAKNRVHSIATSAFFSRTISNDFYI